MVRVYGTGSKPVNGPEDTPVLTRDQLWRALEMKSRNPRQFAPILGECKILGDKEGIIERECTVDLGKWGKRPMRETITTHGDLWIRFEQAEGSVTTNIVSYYPTVADTDLVLTFTFEWDFPSVIKGTPEHEELTKFMSEMAVKAVVGSISRARAMVQEGLISPGRDQLTKPGSKDISCVG